MIYTHAHLDHFGGVLGVVDADTAVPIVAPEHFLEHAVSENVYAGTAMLRRSMYYAGVSVGKGPTGNLGIGLGAGGSTGTPGLIAPTLDDHPHRAGGGPGRGPDRVPDDPGDRVPDRDELLLPRPPGAVHGRERHSQPPQPADVAGRPGPRPADLVALPRRGHRAVRPRRRRVVRIPPLADLGHRRDRRPTSPASATCTPTSTIRRCG